jgi:8-oxo-dGTP pyrophosphatase MutT (NUDIX family)
MHKVYINNQPLIFQDIYKETPKPDGLQILSDSEFTLEQVLDKFNSANEIKQGIIYLSTSPDKMWTQFTSRYVLSEAAGGVVRNELNEVLVIYRKKFWDLPKGKLDYGESPESCAIREVKEECGLKEVETENFLIKTFHTYTEKNKFILKKTHWFTMTAPGDQQLIPQGTEDIEKVKWMTKDKILEKVFAKTYLSIKDVFENYFSLNNN